MVRYPPISGVVYNAIYPLNPLFVRKLSVFGVESAVTLYRLLDSTNTNPVDRTITSGANDPTTRRKLTLHESGAPQPF